MRDADDLGPARDRVDNNQTTGEPDGQVQAPPEQGGQNNSRRIDCNSGGDSSLHEKQERAEQLRLAIEALAQVLIGCVNFQPLIDRNEDRANNNESEWLPKIILDEPDAALVGLARHGKKRDRSGLGREHGEPDRCPANARIPLEVLAEGGAPAGSPKTIQRDRQNRGDKNEIIQLVHKNQMVKR